MSQYTNLPGVDLNVKDGQLNLTQDNTSNSLLIAAPVVAPAYVEVPESPVLVQSEADLKEAFGPFFYKGAMNPIAAEWVIAKRGGIRNVYLLGLKGDDEKALFVDLQTKLYGYVYDMNIEQVVVAGLYADKDVEGIEATDFGEESFDNVEGIEAYYTHEGAEDVTKLTILPDEPQTLAIKVDGRETVLTIKNNFTPEELVDELNTQASTAEEDLGRPIQVNFKLKDGKAVVQSNEEIVLEGEGVLAALKLTEAAPKLKGIANAARLLGEFSESYSNEAQSLISYISVEPVWSTNMSEVNGQVDRLRRLDNNISKHVQVVAGPPVGVNIPGSIRTQWVTGVTQYASLVNSLPVQVAPTNQVLPQANQLRYNLSLRQLDQLTGNKFVTFRVKNNQIVVVDAVTTAPDLMIGGQDKVRSDFTRLSTLRIVNYIVSEMRTALDAYIGQPNEFSTYNAMNTAIKAVIKDAMSNAIIQDATYSVVLGESLDEAVVNLTVLPQFELRKIELSIGLSTPENFNA